MAKRKKQGASALATVDGEQFAILKTSPQEVPELIRANIGADGISPFDLDRIRVPAGGGQVWSIPTIDGDQAAKEFTGVVIFHKQARVYWADEFSGEGTPPDCASDDAVVGVGEPGGQCASCPFARFGSDRRGGKGQACKQLKQLFVIRPGDLLPLVVTLPPTSLTSAKRFLLRLASAGLGYWSVLVRFGLEKARNASGIEYSRVTLSVAERLTAEQADRFRTISEALRPHLQRINVQADDLDAGDESDL